MSDLLMNTEIQNFIEKEVDRQVRQRTAELEHATALLIAEVEELKVKLKNSDIIITELQNKTQDSGIQNKEVIEAISNITLAEESTLTLQDILDMRLKEFCDRCMDSVYGSRFWRYVVNSKKAYEPMFPMQDLMEYTVQDFLNDMRCRLRIKKHYNNETLEKAVAAFSKYQITPFK